MITNFWLNNFLTSSTSTVSCRNLIKHTSPEADHKSQVIKEMLIIRQLSFSTSKKKSSTRNLSSRTFSKISIDTFSFLPLKRRFP